MKSDDNSLNWFEIPVDDLQRAKYFYEKIFEIKMLEDFVVELEREMAFFPSENGNGKVGGALVKSDLHKSNTEGVLIYLNANPDISQVIKRIEEEGGIIMMNKTRLKENAGFVAIFLDTEGNRIGLHAFS